MKTNTTKIKTILCMVLGIATLSLNAQTIITVDNNPGSTTTYQTLQDAHDAATAGDIIYVQPSGTSYGDVFIEKALTIVGRSHSEPGKKSIIGRIRMLASNITLKGLEINQIYATQNEINNATTAPPYSGINIFECEINSTFYIGVSSSQTAPTIHDDVAIRGCVIHSSMQLYADATDVLISNNIFANGNTFNCYNASTTVVANNVFRHGSSNIYIYNYTPSTTLLLFNNMFIFTWASSSDVNVNFQTGDFNLTNNLTYHYGGGNVNFVANGGTFIDSFTLANTNPLFNNIDTSVFQSFADNSGYDAGARLEDDLTLQAGSPALTGGGGGSEIGLYNNGFLYKILGNPRDIPTLDVLSYDGAVEKDGNINVTINAKAH